MKGFVVDENVIIEAINGKKPDGEKAWIEGEFMCRLFRSPNSIFVNDAILKKFRSVEDKIRSASPAADCSNPVCKGLAAMLRDSGRTRYVDGIKVDRKGLKKCGREFVGVAVQSGGILAASDKRLRRIVDEMRTQGVGIECLGADLALNRLEPHGGSG